MSVKPETNLVRGINKYTQCYSMKNNNPFLAGIPDCWYSGVADDLWVEYKMLKINAPRQIVVPHLSLQQLHWVALRKEEGRSIWVVVGYKKGVVIYYTIDEMKNGLEPEEFLARTISRKEMANAIDTYCGTTRAIYNKQQELQGCSGGERNEPSD